VSDLGLPKAKVVAAASSALQPNMTFQPKWFVIEVNNGIKWVETL